MSWQFWVSQVFGILTLVCVFINFQVKGKRKVLAWHIAASALWFGMFFFANNVIGMFLASLGVIRSSMFLICDIKDGQRWKLAGRYIMYAAIGLGLAVIILAQTGTIDMPFHWWDWAVVFASFLFIIGTYLPDRHVVRIGTIAYACALIVQYIIYYSQGIADEFNFMGTLIEISKITSVIVFYCFLIRKGWLINQLNEIKQQVACEVNKIKACSDKEEVDAIMSQGELEKLVTRMVRYEMSVVDKTKLADLRSVDEEVASIMEEIKTVQDVKTLLSRSIEAKRDHLDAIPRTVK